MTISASDFQSELKKIFQESQSKGLSSIVIKSGDLHRRVGGYPGPNTHRMPICCRVMRENMRTNDVILYEPPKGNGATLEIKYSLPR